MRILPIFRYTTAAALMAIAQAGADAPITVTFQNGVNNYEGGFERRIAIGGGEANGFDVTGTATFYVDGGADAVDDAGYGNALIRFDNIENLIPTGAKIINAKLTLTTKTHSNAQSGNAISVYRLSRPFNELSSAMAGGDFGTDGIRGDVDLFLGSFYGMTAAGTVVSADVTDAVQSWLTGTPNYGVGIRTDWGTDAWSFNTSGSAEALRPKLEVTYTLDDEFKLHRFQQGRDGYTGTLDIFLNSTGATVTTPGATRKGSAFATLGIDGVNPPSAEPDIPAMIRFGDIESQLAGRKIESAKLKFVSGFGANANSPGPFTVHRMLTPFTDTSTYSNFAGAAGAMVTAGQISAPIATISDNIPGARIVEINIADTLKAWLAGEPNNGFYIGSGTSNAWEVWTSGAFRNVNGSRVEEVTFRPMLEIITSPALPVEIVAPSNSSRHVLGTPFTLEANAVATAPNTVTNVEFFINGQLVGSDANAPFTFNYPADKLGNYTLTAVMTDSSSAKVTSDAVLFSVVPPAGLGGIYFDGIGDQIALGDPAALKLSTFTIETWFRRETAGLSTTTGTGGVVAVPLIAKGRNQADNSTLDTNWFLGIRQSDGVLCADFEGAGGVNVPVVGKTVVPYGQWQHAAATFDGTHWRLYLNGNLETVLSANGLTPRADSIQHASIATAMNSNALGEGAFGGFMDEVRIWDLARSQAEIRQTINREVTNSAGLVARWSMNEGAGNIVTSTAAAATVGTFGGAPIWTAGTTFSNNTAPSISFLSPVNGGNYLNNQPLDISVSVEDPDGTISKVEYFDNGVSIGVVNSAPFSLTLNPAPGVRRFTAIATDNGGATASTDNSITVYVTFPSPTVPGYTAGIIDGGDQDLVTGTPAASPAPWTVVSSTNPPLAFNALGSASGDIPVSINGTPLPFDAGIVLTSNIVLNSNNLAPLDNIAAPYNSGGNYRVSNRDNNGPGETEPIVSPESSSFTLGWFPYGQGWIGANIGASGSIIGSSSLPAGVTITKSTTQAGTYEIHGLPVSGNLIPVAAGADADNFASAAQTGDNWVVTVIDNNGAREDGDFAILYVPATANRVLSGKIGSLGEFTGLNDEIAKLPVHVRITSQGYELTFGDGSVVNPTNTVLFIAADVTLGNGADNAYSYSANGNSFVIFSHDLPGLNGVLQTGGFRFLAAPINPVTPAENEVNIAATVSNASESGTDHSLVFTVNRSGSTDSPLAVNYTVGGNATPGSDFTALPGSVTIPAGALSAEISVAILTDSQLEQQETVTLTVTTGSGYTPGLYSTAFGLIDDAPAAITTKTVSFQQGAENYTGTFQKRIGKTLSNGNLTNQLGTATGAYGLDGGDTDINDLIRFDNIIGSAAGQIPAGARVLKAELTYTTSTTDSAQSGGPFVLDRLISAVDGSTTYDTFGGTGFYAGARNITARPLQPVAGFPAAAQGQAVAADVTSIVRAWAAGEPNYGFAIWPAGTTDGWNFATISNATIASRPKLVVTYTTAPFHEYTFTADRSARINSKPGSTTANGANLDFDLLQNVTNDSQEALMRFPVVFDDAAPNAIPLAEDIIKAELLISTSFDLTNAHSSGPFSVHQILENWTTSSTYGLHGMRIGSQVGQPVGVAVGMGQSSSTWVDVTSIVRNWRAGAANHGFNIKPNTTDQWAIYFPGTTVGPEFVPRLRITTATGPGEPNDDPVALWEDSFGASGIVMSSDEDHDGIIALVEYALGFNPGAHNTLPGLVKNGDTISISFDKGVHAAGDSRVAYEIWSSPNLVDWNKETAIQNSTGISFSESAAGEGKKFYRLKIVFTP